MNISFFVGFYGDTRGINIYLCNNFLLFSVSLSAFWPIQTVLPAKGRERDRKIQRFWTLQKLSFFCFTCSVTCCSHELIQFILQINQVLVLIKPFIILFFGVQEENSLKQTQKRERKSEFIRNVWLQPHLKQKIF